MTDENDPTSGAETAADGADGGEAIPVHRGRQGRRKSDYRRTRNVRDRQSDNRLMGRMSETREAWVDMPKFTALLFVGMEDGYDEFRKQVGDELPIYDEDTPPVAIAIRFPGRKHATRFVLSGMTVPELDAFKQFLDEAFSRARPICEKLDERALEAYESGDYSHARLYRPIPKVYLRKRLGSEHRPSLLGGPSGTILQPSAPGSDDLRESGDRGEGNDSPGDRSSGVRITGGRVPDDPS